MTEFVSFVQSINDAQKLNEIKTKIEASKDDISPNDFALELTHIYPGFEIFIGLINSVPKEKLKDFQNFFLKIIALILAYQTLQVTLTNNREVNEFEKEKFEYQQNIDNQNLKLEKEKFDYQKETEKSTQKKIDSIESEMNQLKEKFENSINSDVSKSESDNKILAKRLKIKGYDMYKKCKCGSGFRQGICHPYGYDG